MPYRPRGKTRPTTVMPRTVDAMFYQLYFQAPGVAEVELGHDVVHTLRAVLTRRLLRRRSRRPAGHGPRPAEVSSAV